MRNVEITLSGTLMYLDKPLCNFEIECDTPVVFEQLSEEGPFWPLEMHNEKNGYTLIDALREQVVPETRQGLLEDLRRVGIEGYDISKILKHQNASCFGTPYWVRFAEEGPRTWMELRRKIGYRE